MASDPFPHLAEVVRNFRLSIGMTQEELADRSTVSVRALRNLERGVSRAPRRDTIALLAAALKLSPHELTDLEASVARERVETAAKSGTTHRASAIAAARSPIGPRGVGDGTLPRSIRPLIGRAAELATIESHLGGAGRPFLMLAGEPGMGKTRLLAEAASIARQRGWTVLEGGCTGRTGQDPYAPLVDAVARFIATRTPASLSADLDGCAWLVRLLPELAETAVVPAPAWTPTPAQERRLIVDALRCLLANVGGPAGTLLLFDDLHWGSADAFALLATLIETAATRPLRVIGAYRTTELRPKDPLAELLAELARVDHMEHATLGPLGQREALELLTGLLQDAADDHAPACDAQVEWLVQRAGGVPFYLVSFAQGARAGAINVTQEAGLGASGIPWTVAQTILHRVAALTEGAQEILRVAAVLGRVVPGALLVQVLHLSEEAVLDGLEHACSAGLLIEVEEDTYQFAHDLIQDVMLGELSGRRRRMLHELVAEAIESAPGETRVEVLAYHYQRSGNGEKAFDYSKQAGDRAAAVYAHSGAAAYYRMASRAARALDGERRAMVLEQLADQCLLTSQLEEAIQAQEEALALWQALDRQARVGQGLRNLSRLHWLLGHRTETDRCADQAIAILSALPPSVELARACSNKAHMSLLHDDDPSAVRWGRRAVVLARQFDDTDTLCHALTTLGSVPVFADTRPGRARVERSLRLALEHGLDEQATRAYCNVAEQAVWTRDYARATQYLADGLTHCRVHDVALAGLFLQAMRARAHLDQGDWAQADEDATAALRGGRAMVAARIPALIVLGYLRARRGSPEAWAMLDEASTLAWTLGEPNRMMLVAAARAEAAWLEGNVERSLTEAQRGFALEPPRRGVSWCFGELAFWMWRGGSPAEAPRSAAEPFARQIAGDWRTAAAIWGRIGCPYEQAMALADGDEAARRAALRLFERLGAAPAAERVRLSVRRHA